MTFDECIAKRYEKDAEFKKIWDNDAPFREAGDSLVEARNKAGVTQRELTKKTGIAQGDISKIECGCANPSIKTLQRLAEGMGMKVKISFVSVES